MRTILFTLLAVMAAYPALAIAADDPKPAEGQRVFEMRTYVAHEGKFDALKSRFRDHTLKLFEKHGITNIAYFVPRSKSDGSDKTLIYVLAYPSADAAKASWEAFRADPEWKVAAAASEKDGKLVKEVISVFLDPTDFSPIK
ncbi:NIPSNAP family protein [Isosphaeraceae bacterium EP7]